MVVFFGVLGKEILTRVSQESLFLLCWKRVLLGFVI